LAVTQRAVYGFRSPSNTASGKTIAKRRARPGEAKTQPVSSDTIPKISKRESPRAFTSASRS
jgi:hypothetical protein